MNRYSVVAAASACILFVIVDPYSHGWRGDVFLPNGAGWLHTGVATVNVVLLAILAAAAATARFHLARTAAMIEITWLVATNAAYLALDGWQRFEGGAASGLSLWLIPIGLALRILVLVLLTRALHGRLPAERTA